MGSLTVHVVDMDKRGLRGKRVQCHFSGFTHSECYSGSDGVATFREVPVGEVKIYVEGKLRLRISVGQSDYKDVTVMMGR